MSQSPGQARAARIAPYLCADAAWVQAAHVDHYTRAHGFDARFGAAVAAAIAEARLGGWIARAGDRRVGSLFLTREDGDAVRLRLVFVVAEWRGRGLGRRLLDIAEAAAQRDGATRMVVATHAEHAAAGRLYARAGFHLGQARPVVSFGQALTEQHWEKRLAGF